MTVKIAPEAAIDTAATTRTKITMLKNDIIAASIGQAGGATTATDAATMRKARPSSAPSSRDVPAPPSAFEVMEIFTPRIGKVDSTLAIAESESPTAVNAAGGGGLSPFSSLSSMPSSAATAVAAALDDVRAEMAEAEEASPPLAPCASSLPPFAEGSRLKVLNRMGINVRPTNDMVLIQRTANVERNKPDHSGDYLACKIRDVKMPCRAAFFTAVHFGFRFNWWLYSKVAKAICPGGCNAFDARTRWFDEAVLGTLDRLFEGGESCDTVVALAAGFDTRCLRLSRGRPGVNFIELDLPHVTEKKKKLVEKLWPEGKMGAAAAEVAAAARNNKNGGRGSSEIVPADDSSTSSSSPSSSSSLQLRHPVFVGSNMLDPDRASCDLAAAGWRPNAPCATTIEGLLYYLPLDKAEAALETVSKTVASGSTLAFDFWPLECVESGGQGFYGYKRAALMVADLGEPFLTGFPHEPEEHAAFAARFGFKVRELLNPDEIAARYFPHKRHEPSRKKLAVTTFMYFALWEKI